jgi:hypothetical protein
MTKSGMPLKAPLDRVFLEYANNQPRRNVRRASTHMYGEIRHDKDCNDIALVFLESPFDLAPGAVETILVDSTRQVERGDVVSGLGYGFFHKEFGLPPRAVGVSLLRLCGAGQGLRRSEGLQRRIGRISRILRIQ